MEYNTSMNRRGLPHTIQLFSLRSLSEAAENSPTPLVNSYPDNVSLRRHRWALQVTLPQTSITKQNSPSLKHIYTQRKSERDEQTAQRETERQGPDRERNRNEKVEKNIPQTTNIKACVHRRTSFFFSLNLISLHQPHIKTKKPRLEEESNDHTCSRCRGLLKIVYWALAWSHVPC